MGKGNIQDEISEELDQIVEERGLETLSSDKQKGKAFEFWCLDLLGRWHADVDNDPANIPDSGDGGVDILLEDTAGKRFLLAQCHYAGKKASFNIDKWKRLCELADDLVDEERMAAGAYGKGEETRSALVRVSRLLHESGYSVDLFYMTTASAAEEHKVNAAELSRKLGERGVRIELWDKLRLQRVRDESESVEAAAVDHFAFDVPAKQYFAIQSGSSIAHVLTVKASSVAQKYDELGQRLLAWNIRSYLGSNAINSGIRETAEERPDEFYLCNNGITAIAREVSVSQDDRHTKVDCSRFQVINGGQTLASLTEVLRDPRRRHVLSDIPLLFTVIETKETSPTSPFNRRIIQARNTQNRVMLSDFRSNDPIQQWLEKALPKHALQVLVAGGWGDQLRCRQVFYKPKRDSRRKRGALKVHLEDLAKIRYAFHYEPWTVIAYVNQLWTRRGEEELDQPGKKGTGIHDASGKYEKAFGHVGMPDGDVRTWAAEELTQAVFAIVLHEDLKLRITDRLAEVAKKEADKEEPSENELAQKQYLRRARFHAIGLGGRYFGKLPDRDLLKLLKDSEALKIEFKRHWQRCLLVFKTEIDHRLVDVGRDTILRSPKHWSSMVSTYSDLCDMK